MKHKHDYGDKNGDEDDEIIDKDDGDYTSVKDSTCSPISYLRRVFMMEITSGGDKGKELAGLKYISCCPTRYNMFPALVSVETLFIQPNNIYICT